MNFDRLGPDDEGGDSNEFMDNEQTTEPGEADDRFGLIGSTASKRKMSDGTILLIAALCVAGAALWGMKWVAGNSAAIAGDIELETKIIAFLDSISTPTKTIAGMGNKNNNESDMILANLTDDREIEHVPLEMVKKNPFILTAVARRSIDDPVADDEDELDAAELARIREEEHLQYLTDEAYEFEVASIIGKPGRRIAVVGNDVIKVGDILVGGFVVTEINERSIAIELDGYKFIVNMEN